MTGARSSRSREGKRVGRECTASSRATEQALLLARRAEAKRVRQGKSFVCGPTWCGETYLLAIRE